MALVISPVELLHMSFSVKPVSVEVNAGQGEFSAVGFSYGGPAESSHSAAHGPVEDLGEEGCSDSESGQCISGSRNTASVPDAPQLQQSLSFSLYAVMMLITLSYSASMVTCIACQCLGSEDEEQDADKAGDLLAANLGITHFSIMLRRAYKQEQEDVLGQAKRLK